MKVTYLFRIYDSDALVTNMLELILDNKTNVIDSWKLCGLVGKVIRWNSPIHKGTGVYDGVIAELTDDKTGEKSRLIFPEVLDKLKINDERGKYTDNREISRKAIFLGSPAKHGSVQMLTFVA